VTTEDHIRNILGSQVIQIATLSVALEAVRKELEELKAETALVAKPKPE
jgi:hypothetical protein